MKKFGIFLKKNFYFFIRPGYSQLPLAKKIKYFEPYSKINNLS